ncbi:MAG: S8 family serine peptidase [Bacilli bacterium]|nr:S8 family serine peptidase [Bacilli bacterium]
MRKSIKCLSLLAILGAVSVPCFTYAATKSDSNVYLRGRATGRIKYVPAISPQDPYYTGVSKVNRKSQKIMFNHIGDIETIWNTYTGKDVVVAVIDSGIDIDHPDFQGAISDRSGYFYTEYENDDYDSPYVVKHDIGTAFITHDYDRDTRAYEDHGSGTAGVIGARKNNTGTVGIAYDCTLLVLKCDFDDNSINAAIKYAVEEGADVINMSFGAYAEPYFDGQTHTMYNQIGEDYFPEAESSMVEGLNYAHEHGVILVAAAGNECTDTHSYPTCNDYVIGVGALEENSGTTKANYSNYNLKTDTPDTNPSVDVTAPGTVVVPSYQGMRGRAQSTYDVQSGTSFSCPVIVGAAALWKEKYPDGTPNQFEEALFNTANDIGTSGWDTTFGYGALNVKALLEYEPKEPQTATSLTLNKSSLELVIGSSETLVATTDPADAASEVTFTSSDYTIVGVDRNGKVTAVKTGTATITAKIGDLTTECKVTVSRGGSDPIGYQTFCGGQIVSTSIFLSSTSILGFFLLKQKRKEK